MPHTDDSPVVSKTALWSGRIISGLVALFLLFDAVMKILKSPQVVAGTVKAGYPESTIVPIGITLLVSTLVYIIPRTSILGAILLTGYLGGAVATNVRILSPASLTGMTAFFGVLVWFGLFLRDPRVRSLIPLRR